jgi:hypothetical protein
MRDQPDRAAFARLLKNAKIRSASAAWKSATGRDDRSQINKILKGVRDISAPELHKLAAVCKVDVIVLAKILGTDIGEGIPLGIILVGTLSEGGEIIFATREMLPAIVRRYSPTAQQFNGNLLLVRDATIASRFREDDLVAFGDREPPSTSFDGKEMVVEFNDGRVQLRRIHSTDRNGFYTFSPIGTGSNIPPETTDQIRWVARVEAIFVPED